jgi:hypothetical protein
MSDSLTHFISSQEFRLIPLSGKHGEGKFAIVDAGDYDRLSKHSWSMRSKGYIGSSIGSLHRVIMNTPAGMDTDHINGNRLDNRRCNLRIATRAENMRNQHKNRDGKASKYRGVCHDWRSGKWLAQITHEKRNIRIGIFDIEEDAARARDGAAIVLHGEFASLVVPHLEPIPYSPPKPQKRTSQYKGVGWSKGKGKWRAYRSEGKRMIHVGYFEKEIEAYEAVKIYY